jgi:hypothetical protein
MTAGAIVMMVFVIGVVWGGFALLLLRSMRIDRGRSD